MKKRLVIVGNGMVALRLLEDLLELAPDLYDITVFGAEPQPAYNRILLTSLLAGELDIDDILLRDHAWYDANHIRLHTDSRVTRIDRTQRRVIAENGECARYDRLVIATGSQPAVLDVEGKDLAGVVTYRDIADTETLLAATQHLHKAVVIGGGLLGLEAANGLARRGMAVTVVHQSRWILNRQLDEAAATLLRKQLEAHGIRFRLNARTTGIRGENGKVSALHFADDSCIDTDLVVMALGIQPDYRLAEQAGLHCDRGIVVNDAMQTYDPRIYAVGECVSHRGVRYGLVAPLYEQAAVCANHLAGHGHARYAGSRVSTKLKISGTQVFSAGNFMGGDGCEELVFCDPQQGIYKRLVLRDNKLDGAVLYGDIADSSWYFSLLGQGADIAAQRDTLLFGSGVNHECRA